MDAYNYTRFRRIKLNKCAHCSSREVTAVFTTDGYLYFCKPHWFLFSLLEGVEK